MNKAELFGFNDRDAIFSDDRKYRYGLWRIWDADKPRVMFIGLNPSRANENKNDNTITKVIKIARNNGYGGVYMANLFGFITAHPKVLAECQDPLGDNNDWLIAIAKQCTDIVFAWGNFKMANQRSKEVIAMFSEIIEPKCIVQNKNGSPKHPLFCKDDSPLITFINSGIYDHRKNNPLSK